jgi:transcriptional regulator with XRE-family HTH domain
MIADVTEADKEIGKLIKAKRTKLGITQALIAKEMRLSSPVFISLIENGRSKLPLEMVLWFSNRLDIPKRKMRKLLIESATQKIDMRL